MSVKSLAAVLAGATFFAAIAMAHPSAVAKPKPAAQKTGAPSPQSALFKAHCASCHGADLGGGMGPSLKGDSFWARWDGKAPSDLYSTILDTMPANAPGTLSEKDAGQLASYLLERNGAKVPVADVMVESSDGRKLRRPTKP